MRRTSQYRHVKAAPEEGRKVESWHSTSNEGQPNVKNSRHMFEAMVMVSKVRSDVMDEVEKERDVGAFACAYHGYDFGFFVYFYFCFCFYFYFCFCLYRAGS